MKPVFLSYSRKDLDDVHEIAKLLTASGIRIWQDIKSLGSGNTEEQIKDAIREQCSAQLLFATPNSINSDFIKKIELTEAYQRSKNDPSFKIVPLFNVPFDEANKAFSGALHGDLSRYNGAIVRPENPLHSASCEVRKILLKNLISHHLDKDFYITLTTWQRSHGAIEYDLELDWSLLNYREELFSQNFWEKYIRLALFNIKDIMLELGIIKIRVFSKAHLTAGFTFGFIFRPVTGFEMHIQQGDEWWSTTSPEIADPNINISVDSGSIESTDLAVILSVSRDVEMKFGEYLKNHDRRFRAILCCKPTMGASQTAIPDAATASAMAKKIGDAIRDTLTQYDLSDVHIFAAIPLGLSFLIGAQLNACGNIHLYEYDKSTTYSPSWIINGMD